MFLITMEKSGGNKLQEACSLRATWRAIRHLPCEQFPLVLPHVHAIAAPFILWRLKRKGYSNCRVVSREGGLLVFADC
jgi:hypothetical protein